MLYELDPSSVRFVFQTPYTWFYTESPIESTVTTVLVQNLNWNHVFGFSSSKFASVSECLVSLLEELKLIINVELILTCV